jgi:hypothetical protein
MRLYPTQVAEARDILRRVKAAVEAISDVDTADVHLEVLHETETK